MHGGVRPDDDGRAASRRRPTDRAVRARWLVDGRALAAVGLGAVVWAAASRAVTSADAWRALALTVPVAAVAGVPLLGAAARAARRRRIEPHLAALAAATAAAAATIIDLTRPALAHAGHDGWGHVVPAGAASVLAAQAVLMAVQRRSPTGRTTRSWPTLVVLAAMGVVAVGGSVAGRTWADAIRAAAAVGAAVVVPPVDRWRVASSGRVAAGLLSGYGVAAVALAATGRLSVVGAAGASVVAGVVAPAIGSWSRRRSASTGVGASIVAAWLAAAMTVVGVAAPELLPSSRPTVSFRREVANGQTLVLDVLRAAPGRNTVHLYFLDGSGGLAGLDAASLSARLVQEASLPPAEATADLGVAGPGHYIGWITLPAGYWLLEVRGRDLAGAEVSSAFNLDLRDAR